MRAILISIITLSITLASLPSLANPHCAELESTAKSIMNLRQNGFPMTKLIEKLSKSSDSASDLELYKSLVFAAYDAPRYNSEKMKNLSISDFRNEVYKRCLDADKRS